MDVFDEYHSRSKGGAGHTITLRAYGHRWYRVGATDNALNRTPY